MSVIRVGFNLFGFLTAVVECISSLAHSMITLPWGRAMATPPICGSSKQSTFSFVSVTSPSVSFGTPGGMMAGPVAPIPPPAPPPTPTPLAPDCPRSDVVLPRCG
uniref:Putative secreted protein n=1 Tax=Anopheles darlingi TaxID=43151 RepID=A0A2M4D6R2_ANODA